MANVATLIFRLDTAALSSIFLPILRNGGKMLSLSSTVELLATIFFIRGRWQSQVPGYDRPLNPNEIEEFNFNSNEHFVQKNEMNFLMNCRRFERVGRCEFITSGVRTVLWRPLKMSVCNCVCVCVRVCVCVLRSEFN